MGNRYLALIGLCLFLIGVAAGGVRAVKNHQMPGPFDHDNAGFCDFQNGLYFPTLALLRGTSPYGQAYADDYPVDRQIPFFSPAFLAMHAPLAMLPLRTAEYLYFGIMVLLALAITTLTASMAGFPRRVDAIFGIAAALVFARGGHSTLYDGYFTFELILATLLAIYWAERRPWWAAVALIIVSAKPTFILPLGFLLLARGNIKALSIGAVFSIIAAAIPFAWLSYHQGNGDLVRGFSEILSQISKTQEIHMLVSDESPTRTWTRIDLLAVVAKWREADPGQAAHLAVMILTLAAPMLILFRRRQRGIDDGAAGLTGLLIMTTFLISLYHQSYDGLVLIAPLAGVVLGKLDVWREMRTSHRWALAFLIAIPVYNYLSTKFALEWLLPSPTSTKVITSSSGISLLILLVITSVMAWRQHADGASESVTDEPSAAGV